MINLDQLYSIRQKIPKIIRRLFPKISFFKYYFLPTNLKVLPELNYPEKGDIEYQKTLIEKFNNIENQTSSMTYPHLMELLLMKYDSDETFNFLDIGGEKIDFYLSLKKNFKNARYFLFNQKSILETFSKLGVELNYKDLNLIFKSEDIFKINYDFVNFGSCIQYFNNYEELLGKIVNNSKYLFFSGTHLYDSPKEDHKKNLIVKQVNILPQVNYLYFFNRKSFFKIFKDKKFKLIFESENLTDKINYDNFKNYLKNIKYSDFLFVKK